MIAVLKRPGSEDLKIFECDLGKQPGRIFSWYWPKLRRNYTVIDNQPRTEGLDLGPVAELERPCKDHASPWQLAGFIPR